MDNTVYTVLVLSASGSVMALLIMLCRPLLKNRVSRTFAYYIWALVLLRLALPIASPLDLSGAVTGGSQQSSAYTDTQTAGQDDGVSYADGGDAQTSSYDDGAAASGGSVSSSAEPAETQTSQTVWSWVKNNLSAIWLFGFAVCACWFLTAYAFFTFRIRRSFTTPQQDDLDVFEALRGRQNVRMRYSSLISTPMLIGLLRPVIVLPQFAYVKNGMESELKNILLHELTHYRRKDVPVKWAVVLITSAHWFNPLMPFIRKEIGRACELSCDEAVIRGMSAGEKRDYGNTLLELSADRKLPAGVFATTLCEEKNQLKERLLSIMKYRKKSTGAIVLTLILAVLLAGCGTVLGPTDSTDSGTSTDSSAITDGTAYSRKMDGSIVDWRNTGCSYSLDADDNVVISYNNGETVCTAPVTLQPSGEDGVTIDSAGFFISEEKTVIACQNEAGGIDVLISDDMGTTWESSSIDPGTSEISWICTGFTTTDEGWLVVCSFVGLGSEEHYIFRTTDGGATWTPVDSDIDDVYGRMLSGAGFVTDEVGYMCFRYESTGSAAVFVTRDGGQTWNEVDFGETETFAQYNQTPLSPYSDGTTTAIPILLSGDDGENGMIFLMSDDNGETWSVDAGSQNGVFTYTEDIPPDEEPTWHIELISDKTPIEVLLTNPGFISSGASVTEISDDSAIDIQTAIEKAKDSIGEEKSGEAEAISAVHALYSDQNSITQRSVWIVTFQGVTMEKQGADEDVFADESIVLDDESGEVLESFSYTSLYDK